MSSDYSSIRSNYIKANINFSTIGENPHDIFKCWLDNAIEQGIIEPTAMVLSTVNKLNEPSSRVVLLKGVSECGGLHFYTNYNSDKSKHLENNNKASICFFWPQLEQQIRVQGDVFKLSRSESVKYFNSRPLESQISAIASPQSSVVSSRSELEQAIEEVKNVGELSCPEHWGGFILIPNSFEFWQGGANRLHDRILFSLDNDKWNKCRLAP